MVNMLPPLSPQLCDQRTVLQRQSSHYSTSTSQPEHYQAEHSQPPDKASLPEQQAGRPRHWTGRLQAACAPLLAGAVLVSSAQAAPQLPLVTWCAQSVHCPPIACRTTQPGALCPAK